MEQFQDDRVKRRNIMIADLLEENKIGTQQDNTFLQSSIQREGNPQEIQELNLLDLPILAKKTSNISVEEQRKRDDLVITVTMMGFNSEVVEYAANKVEYRGVEQLLEYLTGKDEIDGFYNHDFVNALDDLCLLCHESVKSHRQKKGLQGIQEDIENYQIDVDERQILNQINMMQQQQLIKERSQKFAEEYEISKPIKTMKTCQICYEEFIEKDFYKLQCGHEFCKNCIREHLKQLIMNAKVLHIKCCMHDCQTEIQDNQVLFLLTSKNSNEYDEMIKYLKFKQIKLLDSDPMLRWCPRAGCEKFVRGEGPFTKKLTCECGQQICFKCGRAFHGRFSACDKQLDEQFQEWAKGKEIRICPMCKAHIEKSEGCNHMTCYYCEFQFCWICGGTYSSEHFKPYNPFGCSGQQFSYANPANSVGRFIWLYLRRFLIFVGFLIIMPLLLVFFIPYSLCKLFCKFFRRIGGYGCMCCCYIWFLPLVFAFGLAANAIVVPIAIVFGIPIYIYVQIKNQNQARRQARQRLLSRLQEAQSIQSQIDIIKLNNKNQRENNPQDLSIKSHNEIQLDDKNENN